MLMELNKIWKHLFKSAHCVTKNHQNVFLELFGTIAANVLFDSKGNTKLFLFKFK